MVSVFILTVAAFVIIFIDVGEYREVNNIIMSINYKKKVKEINNVLILICLPSSKLKCSYII